MKQQGIVAEGGRRSADAHKKWRSWRGQSAQSDRGAQRGGLYGSILFPPLGMAPKGGVACPPH